MKSEKFFLFRQLRVNNLSRVVESMWPNYRVLEPIWRNDEVGVASGSLFLDSVKLKVGVVFLDILKSKSKS